MGIQMMGLQGGDQQSHWQQPIKQGSWYNLTLDELSKRFSPFGKPVGGMSLEELLNNVRIAESQSRHSTDASGEGNSSYSTQHQAGLTMARALRGKTVDDIWRDIQLGKRKIFGQEIKIENEGLYSELTLEDFLVKAGMFVDANFGQTSELDLFDRPAPTHNFGKQIDLSRSPSVDTMSDSPTPGGKRGAVDSLDKSVERRLRRKIKNRESAARSRARKQAYYNELMTKVSILEEKNLRLKKDKQLDGLLPYDSLSEKKYQLRRTSSASF